MGKCLMEDGKYKGWLKKTGQLIKQPQIPTRKVRNTSASLQFTYSNVTTLSPSAQPSTPATSTTIIASINASTSSAVYFIYVL